MTLPIDTPRLRLRRFATRDAEELVALGLDREVAAAAPKIGNTPAAVRTYISRQNVLQAFELNAVFDIATPCLNPRR